MAINNVMDPVKIDPTAANNDIQKIRNAIAKLEDSKRSLSKLMQSASMMKGQTGAAIVEQCARLNTEIVNLTGQLNGSIKYIQRTVAKYKEDDLDAAKKIRQGGGI